MAAYSGSSCRAALLKAQSSTDALVFAAEFRLLGLVA